MNTTKNTAPVADLKVKKGDIWKVPFSLIEIEPGLNIRTDMGDIRELAESIRENGIKVPMSGYRKGEKFVPVAGHRRSAACQLLLDEGIEIIVPFIMEAKGTNLEQRIVDHFTTNDGKVLNPLEQAEGVKRLINYGWTEKQIGIGIGKTEGYIRKLNSLNSQPKLFTKLIAEGVISGTFAMKLVGDKKVEEFMDKYDAGDFIAAEGMQMSSKVNESTSPGEEGEKVEYFRHEEDQQPTKITAKHMVKINSQKEFKKFVKSVDVDAMTEENCAALLMMRRILSNEATAKEISEFFLPTAEMQDAA